MVAVVVVVAVVAVVVVVMVVVVAVVVVVGVAAGVVLSLSPPHPLLPLSLSLSHPLLPLSSFSLRLCVLPLLPPGPPPAVTAPDLSAAFVAKRQREGLGGWGRKRESQTAR
jgi:hypothetical protein